MLIKIKLEQKDNKIEAKESSAVSKDANHFEISNDATIAAVKLQIEKQIDIPVERQEITILTKTYDDTETLYDILKQKCTKSVMLSTYENAERTGKPSFLCFLQIYWDKADALLYEQKPKTILEQCIVVSDSTSENESTSSSGSSKSASSSTESSTTDTESGSSVNNATSNSTKRVRKTKQGNEKKKAKSHSLYSPTISSYLDEFPAYGDATETPAGTEPSLNPKRLQFSSCSATSSETPHCSKDARTHIQRVTSTTKNLQQQHYAQISPEKRKFIVVVSKKAQEEIKTSDFEELLDMFYEKFCETDKDTILHFNEKLPIAFYEGKVWIACDDSDTMTWVFKNMQKLGKAYKAENFVESLKLQRCFVVVPGVSKTRKVENIFELLEKQNMSLSTAKWVVENRRIISEENDEYYEKCVSCLCSNEVLFLNIDKESKEFLMKSNMKAKYCFWQILFDM